MKKTTKPKAKPERYKGKAKKTVKKVSRAKRTAAAKTAKKTKALARPRKKHRVKKTKMLSIAELFKLKKKKQEENQKSLHSEQIIPPHDLHDKVNLRPKP